jgi:hypothetical protein
MMDSMNSIAVHMFIQGDLDFFMHYGRCASQEFLLEPHSSSLCCQGQAYGNGECEQDDQDDQGHTMRVVLWSTP